MVVGAGLAGLTCTYRLRRMGVAAVLHEAQGCRRWPVPIASRLLRRDQTAEQGGQFIDTRHRHIRKLVEELGLPLIDSFAQSFPSGSKDYRWLDGALRSDDEVFADFGIFERRLIRDYKRVGSYGGTRPGRPRRRSTV